MLYAHFSEKRSQNKDWWDLKSGKSMEPEPGNLLRVESSQVCRGRWRGSKPTNATCLFLSSGRHTSLKAAGFKSTVALGENGIKGWSINLPYSQVTGHLRAGILMGRSLLFFLLRADVWFMDCPLVAPFLSYYFFFASAFWQFWKARC